MQLVDVLIVLLSFIVMCLGLRLAWESIRVRRFVRRLRTRCRDEFDSKRRWLQNKRHDWLHKTRDALCEQRAFQLVILAEIEHVMRSLPTTKTSEQFVQFINELDIQHRKSIHYALFLGDLTTPLVEWINLDVKRDVLANKWYARRQVSASSFEAWLEYQQHQWTMRRDSIREACMELGWEIEAVSLKLGIKPAKPKAQDQRAALMQVRVRIAELHVEEDMLAMEIECEVAGDGPHRKQARAS